MRRTVIRLGVFAIVLATAFGGGFALGDRGEPIDGPNHQGPHQTDAPHEMAPGETMP